MLELNLNPIILSSFHKISKKTPKGYVFKNISTEETFEYQGKLPKENREFYLFKNKKLLSHRQSKFVSVAYRIEKWFYFNLPNYKLIYPQLKVLFVELLRIQNLSQYLEEIPSLSSHKAQILSAVDRFREKKVKKNVSYEFQFLSKDLDSVELLNQICRIVPLKKIKYTYSFKQISDQGLVQIGNLLKTYQINNPAVHYTTSWQLH